MSIIGDFISDKVENYNPKSKMAENKSQTLDDRIGIMIDMILEGREDARIRQLASNILHKAGIQSKDYEGEICAIFEWVRNNVRYTRDIRNVELFQKPVRSLEMKIGDCDDQAMVLCALLESIGYPTLLKVVGISSKEPEHVYVMVGDPPSNPSRLIALDASENHDCGWEIDQSLVKSVSIYPVDDEEEE